MSFDQIGFVDAGALLNPDSSRYIRTSWALSADEALWFESPAVGVRRLSERAVAGMVDRVRMRNVFSRHSWENSFYVKRLREFSERTVIEVLIPGTPDEIADEAEKTAGVMEAVLIGQTVLYMTREDTHHRLALAPNRKEVVDFTIGPGFTYLRSSSRREREVRGIVVDGRLIRRAGRLGLDELIRAALHHSDLGQRTLLSLRWLSESRFETFLPSAVVKTAIALETLLGLNSTEPLRRSLSERAAFLLSSVAEERERIARAVKRFYDLRSKVVHGHLESSTTEDRLLETADRLCFMLAVVIASLVERHRHFQQLAAQIDRMKWGEEAVIERRFRGGDLSRALDRADV